MKMVFLDAATMGDVSFAPLERLGSLVCYDSSTPQEALERVSDCDVLIVNKVRVTPELIDAAHDLKLICETATGVNNIDIEYAAKKGIPVRNVAGYQPIHHGQTNPLCLTFLQCRVVMLLSQMQILTNQK